MHWHAVAAVGWYGIYDFTTMSGGGGAYLGCTTAAPCSVDKLKAESPISYVSEKTPPILIMHGIKDTTVPVKQAEDFYAL